MQGIFPIRYRPRVELVALQAAIDWSTVLEKSENCEPGGSCSEMLERMSAQNRANRIDLLVKEFQQLGQRIEGRSGDPIQCAGIFWREETEKKGQSEKRR